jgi:hypothetical protein
MGDKLLPSPIHEAGDEALLAFSDRSPARQCDIGAALIPLQPSRVWFRAAHSVWPPRADAKAVRKLPKEGV